MFNGSRTTPTADGDRVNTLTLVNGKLFIRDQKELKCVRVTR
jgi:hypothetical protein